jgi:hypothetical protein
MSTNKPTEDEVNSPGQPPSNSNPVSITPGVRPAAKPPHPPQPSPLLPDTPPADSLSGPDPRALMREMTRIRAMDDGISYKPRYKASSKLVLLSTTQIKAAKVPFTKADHQLAEAIKILTVYLLVIHGVPDVVVHLTDKTLFFPFKWWLEAFRNLFSAKPLKSPDNMIELRILVCRLLPLEQDISSRLQRMTPSYSKSPNPAGPQKPTGLLA